VLRIHRHSLLYGPSEEDVLVEMEQIRNLQQEQISGLILMPISHSNEAALISQTLAPDLPLVLIDHVIPGYAASGVFVDNFGGAVAATSHLIEIGHRRIACLCPEGYVSAIADRVRGYEQAMLSAGLLPLAAFPLHGPAVVDCGEPSAFLDDVMKPLDILLNSPDRPTALFCVDDQIACNVMHYLLRKGCRIPSDMAIAGFNDLPLAAYMPVPLTSVAQPRLEIGHQAAKLLLRLIEEGMDEPESIMPQHIILPVSLIVRDSTVHVF
jgi:DNA-binding LacI/PurR family transcriptional regulator